MSSSWGRNLRLTVFGESHGPAVGVVLDGLPPGIPLDLARVHADLRRRAPGTDPLSSGRREPDHPVIESGLYGGKTTGTPLCARIVNTDARPEDYDALAATPRPGHADYTGHIRYRGAADPRGGGHFSGRLTAPLVFAGAVARQLLAREGVAVGGHIQAIHGVEDTPPDPADITARQLEALSVQPFPTFDDAAGARMRMAIQAAQAAGDSVGGVAACYAVGLPAGLGSPLFDGLDSVIASLLFGIPAVRGVEFGAGFSAARLTGSHHNDPFRLSGGRVVPQGNRHGGLLGGISTGMPLVVRAAFKPTPSIGLPQQTVDTHAAAETTLLIRGRHDPCILPRALVCVEACVALAILDCALEGGNPHGFKFPAPAN